MRYDFRLSAKFHTGFRLRKPLLHRITAGLAFVYKLIPSFPRRFQLLNFALPHFRNKKGRVRRRGKFRYRSSRHNYRAQKRAGRLANFASQHAKIAAVIAQKLQNVVSDSLRTLGQKQLLQKGKNFALLQELAAVVGIKVKPGHKKARPF